MCLSTSKAMLVFVSELLIVSKFLFIFLVFKLCWELKWGGTGYEEEAGEGALLFQIEFDLNKSL